MGKIREIVKQADSSPEVKKEIGETLALLMEMCDLKIERFEHQIEENLKTGKIDDDSLLIPIDHIIHHWTDYRCKTKETNDLLEKVKESITEICKGTTESVINGISSIITNALDAVIGTGEGSEHITKLYTCCIDGSGEAAALVRYDMMVWTRNITASALSTYMESAFAMVLYKSSINVSKISFNDFRSIYIEVLEHGLDPSLSKEDREKEIMKSLEMARKIYDELRKESPCNDSFTVNDLRNRTPINLVNTIRLK